MSRQPVYTARLAAEARRLYRTGLSSRAVARELRAQCDPPPSHEWVRTRIREAGIVRSSSASHRAWQSLRNRRDYGALARTAARLWLVERLCQREIARRLGVSRSAVLLWLRSAGVALPGRRESMLRWHWAGDRPEVLERRRRRAEVVRLRRQGMSYRQIAEGLGIPTSLVESHLRSAGLVVPRRSNAARTTCC